MARMQASELLKKSRQMREMNLYEASCLSGYSERSIGRWENGKSEPKFSAVLDLLQDVYHISLDEALKHCMRCRNEH